MGFLKKLGSSVARLFGGQARRGDTARGGKARRIGTMAPAPTADWRGPPNLADDSGDTEPRLVEDAQWYPLVSSNVDRIRYGDDDKKLQVVFKKKGSLYEYDDVEPDVFMEFLRAPSPGQFVWYVLRQYGYAYRHLADGHSTSSPAAPRFDEQPYAVPEHIQKVQAAAGRKPENGGLWNSGTPKAGPFAPPPGAYKNSAKFPPAS